MDVAYTASGTEMYMIDGMYTSFYISVFNNFTANLGSMAIF